jgi:hypothetical protein
MIYVKFIEANLEDSTKPKNSKNAASFALSAVKILHGGSY